MRNVLRQLTTLATTLTLAALFVLSAGSASGQMPNIIPGRTLHSVPGVRASQTPRAVLDGTAVRVGHYDPTNMLRLAIVLVPPHPVEEGQFLQDLQDKTSPLFHQYLTPEDWTARFGPSAEDEQAVADWAQSQGFTITYRSKHRMVVDVEAPAGVIEKVLGVTINKYQVPNDDGTPGEILYSADRDPLLPSRIASVVGWVGGLNSFERVQPASGPEPNVIQPDYVPGPAEATQWTAKADAKPVSSGTQAETSSLTSAVSPPSSGYYQPTDIWSDGGYDFNALMNQGHCCNPTGNAGHSPQQTSIAIAGYDPLSLSDVANFQSYFSYLAYQIETIGVDGGLSCSPSAGTCGGEASLDNEWAISTSNSRGSSADTAKVYYYNAPNTDSTDVWTHIMDDSNARVMSQSWGGAEPNSTDAGIQAQDSILATMAGEGWTLLFSSGDQGSTGACNDALKVIYPASDPNVIAVGGTTLQAYQRTEVGWTGSNSSGACSKNGGGSTGGFSDVWPTPGFQSGMGFNSRAVPDISLNASIGQDVYVNNAWAHPAGTSIAAPMMAGFMAQENAYLLSLGNVCGSNGKSSCGTLGDVNYAIYTEGNTHDAAHIPFYDITSGCSTNDITQEYPNLVAWCAGPGFDEVTGWGSANMLQLAWAINWQDTTPFGTPYVSWSGPTTNKWYNSNQNVSWTVVDYTGSSSYNGTGIAGFNQGWDSIPPDSASYSPAFNLPLPADTFFDGPQFVNGSTGCLALASGQSCSGGVSQGCHTAHVRGFNNQGETTGDATYGPLCYDTVAPTVTLSTSPAVSSGVWTNQPVTVTLSASDPGGSAASGIATTYYGNAFCFPSQVGPCNTYTSPFNNTSQGSNTIYYFTEDKAGNFSSLGSFVLDIDLTAPTTTLGLTGSLVSNVWQSAVTATLTATDSGGSGVKNSYYSVDGGTTNLYSGSFTISTPGSHTIVYYSSDNAGNTEAHNNDTFTIASPVSTTLSVSPSTSIAGTTVTLKATLMPTLGGTPTGSVTFYNGMTKLGSANLSGLTASLMTSSLPVGSDSLTAVYGGATYYLASTSSAVAETVNPALSLSPSSLTFSSTAVGATSAAQMVTLTNNGSSPISFTASTTITGTGASSFVKSASTCSNPLAAGASCTNSFEFKPTTTGARTATVTYTDNATGSPNTVALSGTGIAATPTLSLSPSSLTFPSTAVGSTSAVQTVTLTNTGTVAVNFTASTTITGSGASSFIKSASTCSNPLAAGVSCTNSFEFEPTTTGTLTATVTYTDNATGSANTISLSGTGTAATPKLTLSPTSLTFPSTAVGSTSAVQLITLTNTGTSPVSFTASTTITGSGASSFIKSASTCSNPLPAGASCTNSIEFKPTTTGALTATVTYTDNATGSPNTVSLSGTGGSATPTLSISPASLTFPSTAVGSTSAVQLITLTNTGTAAVSFTASTTITGSGASSFTKTASTCPNPLPAGASCTNSIEFKPTTTGTLTATVTYTDNATGSPNTVALSGTGTSATPTLSLSATSLTFPSTTVGSTSTAQTITLTNTGTTAVSFTASTTITGSGASSFMKSASTCTNPLAAGASCTNSFEFKPTTTGALSATVTYTDNATGSPNTVALSGTGQ